MGLVFLQIVLGAFVAGLKAGAVLQHVAADGWARSFPTASRSMQPWYLNLFENALAVQFNHRLVAYVLLVAALCTSGRCWRRPHDVRARTSGALLAVAVLAQAVLGIWTLLAQVPLALGLAHQAGAAAVFGVAVWHLHVVRHAESGSVGAP